MASEQSMTAGENGTQDAEVKESEQTDDSVALLWTGLLDCFAGFDVFGEERKVSEPDGGSPCEESPAQKQDDADAWLFSDPFGFNTTTDAEETIKSTEGENAGVPEKGDGVADTESGATQDWTEMIFGASTTQEASSTTQIQDSSQPTHTSSESSSSFGWFFGEESTSSDSVPSRETIMGMSIKDLKALIDRAGMNHADCLEKADLRNRAIEAAGRLTSAARHRLSEVEVCGGKSRVIIRGGLQCIVVGHQGREPDLVVFLFHGYHATAASLVPLAERIMGGIGRKDIQFVIPQHPDSIWWPIDWTSYMYAMMSGEAEKARVLRATPAGVAECRELVSRLILEHRAALVNAKATALDAEALLRVPEEHLYPTQRLAFMGFSQGAMLALDSALGVDSPVAGAVLVSGFLIDVERWARRLTTTHKGLKVLQTHGFNDQLIPFNTAYWLNELLTKNGAKVQWIPHSGGHDMGSSHILTNISTFIASIIKHR